MKKNKKIVSIILLGVISANNIVFSCTNVYAISSIKDKSQSSSVLPSINKQNEVSTPEPSKKTQKSTMLTGDTRTFEKSAKPAEDSKTSEKSEKLTEGTKTSQKKQVITSEAEHLTNGWEWSINGNTITLEKYIGDADADVIVPTSTDLGDPQATVQMDSKAMRSAVEQQATSIRSSKNGNDKVVAIGEKWDSVFASESLKSVDLTFLDVSNVRDMRRLFSGCHSLSTLDVSGWDTSKVTDMSWMFTDCHSLSTLNVSGWDTSKVTTMFWMFKGCDSLSTLDLSGWDTSKVTNMTTMFTDCHSLSTLNVSGWDTSEVTTMANMFTDCHSLSTLNVSGWDTSKVTNMLTMFADCHSLSTLDLSGWDTSKVTDMSWMFTDCYSLSTLNVSGWDTSKVTNMLTMFADCHSLSTLDLSGWDTSKVTNMANMFTDCHSLSTLNVSGWDTSKVTTMANMFKDCDSLSILDLSSWDTSKVTDMNQVFIGKSKPLLIKTKDEKLRSYDYMADGLTKLGTVRVESEYGNIQGKQTESLFDDYTTDQPLDDTLITKRLETLEKRLVFSSGVTFDSWQAERNYQTFLEKANGSYTAIVNVAQWKSFGYKTGYNTKYYTTCTFKSNNRLYVNTSPVADSFSTRVESSNGAVKLEQLGKNYSGNIQLDEGDKVSLNNSQHRTSLDIGDTSKYFLNGSTSDFLLFNMQNNKLVQKSPFELKDGVIKVGQKWKASDNVDYALDFNWKDARDKVTSSSPVDTSQVNPNPTSVEAHYAGVTKKANVTVEPTPITITVGDVEWHCEIQKIEKKGQNSSHPYNAADINIVSSSFKSGLPVSKIEPPTVGELIENNPTLIALNPSLNKVYIQSIKIPKDVLKYHISEPYAVPYSIVIPEPIVPRESGQDLEGWDDTMKTIITDNQFIPLENFYRLFFGDESLVKVDLSGLNTSKVTNMSGMFSYCKSLSTLDISHFDTSKVTDMSEMFGECNSLSTLDVSHFDTSKVTNMSYMFGCDSLSTLDISTFDTSKVTNMSGMFGCDSLSTLDVSTLDTSNVTDMSYMFNCKTLSTLDVSTFDTSKVTDMSGMFMGCNSLSTLDVSHFDTSKVTDMSNMFLTCRSLSTLNVSGWDTSKVTDMSGMFVNCTNLIILDLSNWVLNEKCDNKSMFTTFEKKIPLLIKTTDEHLKRYDYEKDSRDKLGILIIDSEEGNFSGKQKESLFDYTTDQEFDDKLITHQLDVAKRKITFKPTFGFEKWKPEANYTTFLEKANGNYTVQTLIAPDCNLVVPTSYKLTDTNTLSKGNIRILDSSNQKQYSGKLKAKVTISSKKNFKLGTEQEISSGDAAEYQLVDDNRNAISPTFILDSVNNIKTVNTYLKTKNKVGKKGTDSLEFNYQFLR